MGTANNELLAKLHAAISGWTTEVGTVQQHVSQQIAGANSQLERLLTVLHERNGHVAELAKADAEIVHLKQALENAAVPPGTVTHYTPQTAPPLERVRQELDTTVDRLNGAVQGWTNEVATTQKELAAQFTTANAQLGRLIELLADADGGPSRGNNEALAQVQHERDVLSAEVQTLNIELETLRRDQASFAEANLNSEAQRDLRQRQEVEALREALAERDTFVDECQELLQDSQRIEAGLNEEIETLTLELEALRATPPSPHAANSDASTDADREALLSEVAALTEQQATLESALSEARETIDRLQAEAAEKEAHPASDGPDTDSAAETEALVEARETVARLEQERDDALAKMEELDVLRAQVQELTEAKENAEKSLDELTALRESQATLESALTEARETIDRLQAEAAEKEARPTGDGPDTDSAVDSEALAEARETVARLEQERDDALAKMEELDVLCAQVQELTEAKENAEKSLDELTALRESQATQESALTEARETIDRLQAEAAEKEAHPASDGPDTDSAADSEALAEARETVAILEQERDDALAKMEELDVLRAQVQELTEAKENAEKSLDELTALRESQATQESALTEARETIDRLQAEAAEKEAHPASDGPDTDSAAETEALAEARETVARLEQERDDALAKTAELSARQSTTESEAPASTPAMALDAHQGLEGAMAALEEELAHLQRREEESLASARTLLQELETHRSFEAAQETSLSMARGEIEDLRVALDDKNSQLQTLEREHRAALAEAREEAEMLRAALEEQTETQRQHTEAWDSLQAETTALRERVADLQTQLADRETAAQTATLTLEEARAALDSLKAEKASAEQEFRESQETAENWIDDLDKQLAASQASLEALQETHEALTQRYDTLAGELETAQAAERERSQSVDEVRAETAEAKDRIAAAEATVADLQAELGHALSESDAHVVTLSEQEDLLAERQQALEELEAEIAHLQEERAETRDALGEKDRAIAAWEERYQGLEQQFEALTEAKQALAVERDQLTATLAEISEKSATQEANLTEALTTLESQQQALQERDAQIETFRHSVSDMTAQMATLSEEEREAKRQADQLKEALDAIEASDAQHVDELEQSRLLLEQMRTEHLQQQETANQLAQRGDELEALLKEAQQEEISTLATVEELQSQVHTLQDKEAAESQALEETRAQVSAHQEKLQEREQRVAQLKARLTEVLEEKEALHVRTAEQEAAIQATMAEVSQIVTERDELRDALEKTKEEKGRIYVGEAGAGLSADEAAMSREQRARQQEILLSELTQYDGNRSLGDILADAQVISRAQLKAALEIQAKDPSQLLGTILIEQDMTTDDAIAQAVACQLGKSVVNPMEVHIQPKAVAALNGDICTWHVCVPLRITADRLVVAMANPLDESAIYKLRDVSQREITPVVGAASQIMNAIEVHYGTF